jgi:hypothetical protein
MDPARVSSRYGPQFNVECNRGRLHRGNMVKAFCFDVPGVGDASLSATWD